jgi:hypothetical protein
MEFEYIPTSDFLHKCIGKRSSNDTNNESRSAKCPKLTNLLADNDSVS